MRESLFMNSRDRLQKSGELVKKIKKNLERILSNHQGLKNLKNKRYEEQVKDKLDDSKPLQEVIENIMKSSPSLSKIFLSGEKLNNPLDFRKGAVDDVYNGKMRKLLIQSLYQRYSQLTADVFIKILYK